MRRHRAGPVTEGGGGSGILLVRLGHDFQGEADVQYTSVVLPSFLSFNTFGDFPVSLAQDLVMDFFHQFPA